MKKVFLSTVIAITMSNCSKNKQVTPVKEGNDVNSISSSQGVNLRTIPTKYRELTRTMGAYNCNYKNGNCLPDVIVKPKAAERVVFLGLIDVISTGNQEAIIEFFITNYTVLNQYIPVEEMEAVINGVDQVTNEVNPDGFSNYIFFKEGEVTMLVFPVILV